MSAPLPWWIAAAALGAVTVGHWIAVRRPLGVSGILGRFAALREERAAERAARALRADAAALEAAMLAATAEATAAGDLEVAGPVPAGRLPAPVPALSAHAVFLAALVAGGLLARVLAGGPSLQTGLPGPLAARLGEPGALLALLGGGALVGFGTAACGGCTAGHGLTGCARLSPGSLLAAATFFGAAVATSFLLGRLA